ncbi:hypothetical protein [Kosakonia cowanii]
MRLTAKELIAEARTTAPTLPPAAAKLMTAMADRLDLQFVALCESRNEAKQLAAEITALKRIPKTDSVAMLLALDSFRSESLPDVGIQKAFESLLHHRETPTADLLLGSIRSEVIAEALENCSDYLDTDCVMDRHDISYDDAELRAAGAMELHDSLVAVANHLRNKAG